MTERDPLLRGRNGSSSKTGACVATIFGFVFALGVFLLVYMVDARAVFLDPPKISLANVPYYIKPGFPITATSAAVNSFNWFVYMSDFLMVIPTFYIPGGFLIATLFNFSGLAGTGLPIILWVLFFIELVKSGYFLFIWLNWFGLKCVKHPFCIQRDPFASATTADSTFVWEAIITFAFTILLIISALVLPRVYKSGKKERMNLMGAKCGTCGEKNKTVAFDLRGSTNSSTNSRDVIVGDPIGDQRTQTGQNTSSQRRTKKQAPARSSANQTTKPLDVAASTESEQSIYAPLNLPRD
jgi:hypothetical protein